MKVILFLILILSSFHSMAHESFLRICTSAFNEGHEAEPALRGLINITNDNDCRSLADTISKRTSISELTIPGGVGKEYKKYKMHWTDDVPYMYGVSTTERFKDGHAYHHAYYSYLPLFRDFKNLIHISILPEYSYYSMGICKILDTLPHIKVITINSSELENPENDKCLSRPGIKGVIIRDDFSGYDFRIKTRVIGLESYTGTLSNLARYPHLKYLSITNTASFNQETTPLTGNINITHFSMNSKSVKNIEFLSHLINIEYLQLTCIEDESKGSESTSSCKSGAYLRNLDFLQNFAYLRSLNLSYNSLENIDGIERLERLERLALRGNKIRRLPSFSRLSSLRYLDLSGNEIDDISTVMMGNNAYTLNLSGNNISDVSSLSNFKSLVELNLSNNPIDIRTIRPVKGLKSLNLNGASGGNIKINWQHHVYNSMSAGYSLKSIFNNDFHLSSLQRCETRSSVNHELDLSGFDELEALSLENNQLSVMPDFSGLSKLKYLSLERNNLREIRLTGLKSLRYLDLSVNKLTKVPETSDAPYLQVLDLISNDITEIKNYSYHSPVVFAGNNLIRDISVIEGDSIAIANYDLRGNPVEGFYCPDFRVGLSQQFCPDSNIEDWNVEKPENMDLMTWHESKKCPISE